MNAAAFNRAYEEQNEREYIANATFGSIVSIPLQLSCLVMDYFMYGSTPGLFAMFVKVRIVVALLTFAVLTWFRRRPDQCPRRLFGITWFSGPLLMVLWMIYYVSGSDAKYGNTSPYYAGLNIILLAMGLISPWTYVQNLVVAVFTLLAYGAVAVAVNMSGEPQPTSVVINNSTFLFLTAAFVILGSRASARLRLQEFTLRWELDESRRSVEENNKRLVELDEAKSRFFANISHELRTPLTLLIAPLETLLHHHRDRLGTDSLSLLQTMHGNSLRLLKLINDLLNIVRLESGKLQVRREPVMVADFVRGLVSAARQMADDKRITLETDVTTTIGAVMLDRDKVEKTLLNLVFNALKFTPSGGRVSIHAARDDKELVLSVRDTGVGIPKAKLGQAFTRFWQADDSSSRKYQGVGIGLSLVKEFTELQGGTVAVESEEGKGSTFTVRLPYQEVTAEDAAKATAEAPAELAEANASSQEWLANLYRRAEQSPAGSVNRAHAKVNGESNSKLPKVLVADDEPDMLHFISSQLSGHYQVIHAIDGDEAVRKAVESAPELILTDMMMPGKDGVTVCKELREHPKTRSIPIVMITARADEETKLAALNAGANDFLPKPFSTTELHVRVKNLLESHQFQRSLEQQNKKLESAYTELRQTQDQLITKEKQASLGVWSAGIIHEMNNPLNFARTGLYALRNKGKLLPEPERPDFNELVADIEDGVQRVHTIVSDLRTYAHPGREAIEEVAARDAVRVALRFFSADLQGFAEVTQNVPEDQFIHANKNKLIQVLANLLQNALDAMKMKNYGEGHPKLSILGRVENGRSQLIVRDNGPGIAQQHLDKIFDPFFTTKDVGQGMGLGLGICYRIAQEFGGQITVKTEVGQYCEFTLDFPAECPVTNET